MSGIRRGKYAEEWSVRESLAQKGETISLAKDPRRQIRAHVRWKSRSRNDVQTEGRPRPPPGNTVITIITYRALILISPSYISLSIFLYLPPWFHGDSSVRRLGRVKADFFRNLPRESIERDLLLARRTFLRIVNDECFK